MASSKVLAVDLDSTLADVQSVFIKIVKEDFNKDVKYDDIKSWSFWFDLIGPSHGWDCFKRIWTDRVNEVELMQPKMAENLYKILGKGYQVSIITATQKECIPNVIGWLDKHGIPYKSLIGLYNGQSKFDYPWDAIVDDNPKMALEACQHKDRKIFLFDQPWNRDIGDTCAVRVTTFDELLQDL